MRRWFWNKVAEYCLDKMADIRLIDPFMKDEKLVLRYFKYAELSKIATNQLKQL